MIGTGSKTAAIEEHQDPARKKSAAAEVAPFTEDQTALQKGAKKAQD
jgi:hypothetical protein